MRYIISHTDLDGFGVNILESLFHDTLGFDSILNKNYGFENETCIKELITPENEILITDLSIPEDVYVSWKSILKSLRIIDHHETSVYLTKYDGNIWSVEQSGTSIFWYRYLRPMIIGDSVEKNPNVRFIDKIDKFVDLVDCYDRWVDTSDLWDDAARLNKLCTYMNYFSFIPHMCKKLTTIWEWTEEECAGFEEIESEENHILGKLEESLDLRKDEKGLTFAFLEIDEKSKLSMVCSKLMRKHPEINYCVCYSNRRSSFSLRTRDDIDLTRLHGVMGHKKAAGAKYTKKEFYKMLVDGGHLKWVGQNQRKSDKIIVEV